METDSLIVKQSREVWWQTFKLEPALFTVFMGWNLATAIFPNQLLKQTCMHFGNNATDCNDLNKNNKTIKIEEEIQPQVAQIIMVTTLMMSIIPAFLSLFLCPWTDKFGRKKIICATFSGFSTSLVLLTLISFVSKFIPQMNTWFYVIAYIPMAVSGGWPSMTVVIFCYITDITDEKNRSTRFTVIAIVIFAGVLCGTFWSSFILNMTSLTAAFLISAVCVSLATTYTISYVDESVRYVSSANVSAQMKELLSLTPVKEMVKTCFKPRPNAERRILLSLSVILMFTIFALNGTDNVFYLFVRLKFQWTLQDETIFNSVTMLITTTGSFLGIGIFKKVLKFSDIKIAVIALLSVVINSLILAFSQTPTQMYLASIIAMFKWLGSPMCRSIIAATVPANEIGKVYSFAGFLEASSNLISSPLYTLIYTSTFKFFAGAFYLITAGIYTINLILIYYVFRLK